MGKKPSAFLVKMQQEFERKALKLIWFYIQQHNDISMIALNRAFGFGPERLKKYNDTLKELWPEYSNLKWQDGKDDRDETYTKGILDREMQRICGPYFEPWEVRYSEQKAR